jgi:hypothetical protein
VAAAVSMWLRRGATAVAASRVGVGFVALGAPLLVSRSWVGRSGDGAPGTVLGRALGSRDLALGLGALIALRRQDRVAGPRPDAAAWVGLAALADGFDLLTTMRSWDELPAGKRWLVALSSGGAAAAGAAGAAALLTGAGTRAGAGAGADGAVGSRHQVTGSSRRP